MKVEKTITESVVSNDNWYGTYKKNGRKETTKSSNRVDTLKKKEERKTSKYMNGGY